LREKGVGAWQKFTLTIDVSSCVLMGFRDGIACALPERESCEKRRTPGRKEHE
jgi:hypothetical protein